MPLNRTCLIKNEFHKFYQKYLSASNVLENLWLSSYHFLNWENYQRFACT